jgi:hypothetical protein
MRCRLERQKVFDSQPETSDHTFILQERRRCTEILLEIQL